MHLSIRFRHKATPTAYGEKESLIVLEQWAAGNPTGREGRREGGEVGPAPSPAR